MVAAKQVARAAAGLVLGVAVAACSPPTGEAPGPGAPETEPPDAEPPDAEQPSTETPAVPAAAAQPTPLEAGMAFLAENEIRASVVTTASGLQYEVLASGEGATPGPRDMVTTHYHGTLIDGTVFDSSVQRGQPIAFPVNGVINGWTEALQLMQVGDKWKLYIPPDLAYGGRGSPPAIGPNETLIFEVELLDVQRRG